MKQQALLLAAVALAASTFAGVWTPYEGNPVLGNAKLGTCFDVNVITDGPAPYTMYFSWRTKDAIALVRSNDGFHWTQEPEICLEKNPASGWEMKLNRSCTVRKDGLWHMWYTGQYRRPGEPWASKMGYATSKDGVHFTRVRKDPVMVPERDFEKNSVMNPYVRWDEKRALWRMWYAAGDTYEPNVLCYAESKDGVNWEKYAGNPIFTGAAEIPGANPRVSVPQWDRDRVGACEVHSLPNGTWAMFYIGYSDVDTARIGCAISRDGITNWRRIAENPLVSPDLCTWNSSACYKPSVLRDERNNRWILWYNGRNGRPEYVGMAIHEGLDLEAPVAKVPSDTTALLKDYVRRFNAKDVEHYTNAIPNAAAEDFMLKNCPRFACPNKDIERTYYFRWWTFRKHLRHNLGHWTITEFLPKVGWSGTDNTIVCPAGHHLREARWLRDAVYVTDDAKFWLSSPEAGHRWKYCSWLYTATCQAAEVTGDDALPVSLLDAAVDYYSHWEVGVDRGAWPEKGKAHMGGDGKGGFTSIDNYEGTELSLGGNGYKPLMASAMASEAATIARVAARAGRKDLTAKFAAKAETARQSLLAHCWNPEVNFFTTAKTNGTKGVVRELHGYAPWYFGLKTDGCWPDWTQLTDPQGFAARYGLTFPERRAKGFAITYTGHECKWDGPSWPFATSIALTALANEWQGSELKSKVEVEERTGRSSLFTALLWQYADAQRLTHPTPREGGDWEVVPWIDENLNPDKAEWLSRKIILETPKMRDNMPKERGKDYNHSTYCDLVISGLVGFVPNGAKGFTVDPLFPADWDYLVLENLRYRGHDVAIRWHRSYEGLTVEIDGQVVAQSPELARLTISLSGTVLSLPQRQASPSAAREGTGSTVPGDAVPLAAQRTVLSLPQRQASPSAAAPEGTGNTVRIDFAQTAGPVKPVNAIGQPPMVGMPMRAPMFHYLKEAGIPYSRLHDVGGWQGQNRYVDIPNVFRNFDADENDPKNYDFSATDILITKLVENGVEPFYRLGVTIENPWEWGLKIGSNERIVPPKDFAKWARICEHVIRHYTEGWANGFKYKMTYWEIWNEPDNRETVETNPLWQAEFSEYIRFYGVVAPYLKSKFPHLKIGGYGMCGFYDAVGAGAVGAAHSSPRTRHFIDCVHAFLKAARANKWPLDFFSFHSYSDAPDALRQVHFADSILDSYGFTREKTERVYNEWLPVVAHENLGTAKQAAQIAAELIGLQNGPCDVACIYDGRCGVGDYSPLFNPMTYKPHKAYYVYRMFNELRKLGTAVKVSVGAAGCRTYAGEASLPLRDVYVTAATDGTNAFILAANISKTSWRADFDFGDWKVIDGCVIDEARTFAFAPAPKEIAPNATWLIRLRKNGTGESPYYSIVEPEPETVTRRIELLKDNDLSAHWYAWLSKTGRDNDPLHVFTASGGVLRVSGRDYGCVTTKKAYRNYRLSLEYRFVGDGELDRRGKARDGGILYHSTGPDGAICGGNWMMGFEFNIIQGGTGDLIVAGGRGKGVADSVYTCEALVAKDGFTPENRRRWHHDPKGTWVGLGDWGWMRSSQFQKDWKDSGDQALLPNEKPIGEWNRCELICNGWRADYYFNGKRVNWMRKLSPSGGRIQLQSEAQAIEYRNIVLDPL